MYSELYRLDEGGAELVGGYSANLVKGETGVGDPWPELRICWYAAETTALISGA